MILIYLSHQSYEKTSRLSWKLVLLIAKFLNKTQLAVIESYDDAHLINKYLRKLAHFLLFLSYQYLYIFTILIISIIFQF